MTIQVGWAVEWCAVQLFSMRYDAAKLIEEEQEAEIEEAERRKAVPDIARTEKSLGTGGRGHSGGGGGGDWYESESGMFWEPAGDTSALDSSADGLAVLHAKRQEAAALAGNGGMPTSQEDDENYTRGNADTQMQTRRVV